MEQKIKNIAFYGSPYEYYLFCGGLSKHTLQNVNITKINLPDISNDNFDLLVIGHQPPEHDGNLIISNNSNIQSNIKSKVLIAHGVFPLEGYPAPENLNVGAFNFRWVTDISLSEHILQLIENQLNANYFYTQQHRRFLLLVEDEITYASYFIPLILNEINHQTASLLPLDQVGIVQKIKSERPILLLASSYEKASYFLDQYKDRMVGVISSLGFLKNGQHKYDAGIDLIRRVKSYPMEIPIVIQTKHEYFQKTILENKAGFLRKKSSNLLKYLRQYLLEHFGFGDFIFRMPEDPTSEIARAKNISELQQCIMWIPDISFIYHAENFHFSNWLAVHGHLEIAEQIRPIKTIDPKQTKQKLLSYLSKLSK